MTKLKYLLGSGAATLALALGFAVAPVAAQGCNGVANCNDTDVTTTVDDSTNVNVSGDCSAAFVGDNYQSQSNSTNQTNANSNLGGNLGGNIGGALLGGNDQSNDQSVDQSANQSNSNSNSQSQTGNSFEADCSTTNVTNVTKQVAASDSEEAQVASAPKGGVHAGLGSTAKSAGIVSVVGLTGSLSVLGIGLRALKGEL